jgi:hypothetical protein
MNARHDITEALIDEIARYLGAVDVFRAEACEPMWLPEPARDRRDENADLIVRDQVHAAH